MNRLWRQMITLRQVVDAPVFCMRQFYNIAHEMDLSTATTSHVFYRTIRYINHRLSLMYLPDDFLEFVYCNLTPMMDGFSPTDMIYLLSTINFSDPLDLSDLTNMIETTWNMLYDREVEPRGDDPIIRYAMDARYRLIEHVTLNDCILSDTPWFHLCVLLENTIEAYTHGHVPERPNEADDLADIMEDMDING